MDDSPDAKEALRKSGLRVTKTRVAVLGGLAQANRPITLENLHDQLGGSKQFDLVTLYRSLHAFVEAGIVVQFQGGDGKLLYEWQQPDDHHHHVMCRHCGRIDKIPHCNVAPYEEHAREIGYRELTHVLELYGVCPNCE